MSSSHRWILISGLCAAVLWAGLHAQTPSPANTGLVGTVKSADGKPMEGVAVSARARQGRTITTSVWTDQNGQYYFPTLDDGQYQIWAQAVGFDRPVAEQTMAGDRKVEQNFTLKPIQNYLFQLSSAEWLESLPAETAFDRRMKQVLMNTCSNCHQTSFGLEKRFDAQAWDTVLTHMIKISSDGDSPESSAGDPVGIRSGGIKFDDGLLDDRGKLAGPHYRLMSFYKKDTVEYLTRVRGPKEFPITPKPFPRPTGDATKLVVVEYDAPASRGGGGASIVKLDPKTAQTTQLTWIAEGNTTSTPLTPIANEYRSGSDWSLGTRAESREGGRHDIALGGDGNIYYGGGNLEGALDGGVWWGGREFIYLDVKTQTIKRYPGKPIVMTHGKGVDTKGLVWTSTQDGAARFDPKTGQVTEFKSITPFSRPYDMAIDRFDNIWFSQIAIDKMGVVDSRTGDVTEVPIGPYSSPDLRPEDLELARQVGSWDWNSALTQQGPRRMGADRNGDYVYAGLYWTGGLAQFDARTKTLKKRHQVPNGHWIQPYKVLVDKNHMAWVASANADLLAKFNPFTEQFTMYHLPTRGSNTRHMTIDDSTDPPTIWLPYIGAQKIARVQFRTNTAK
jgi:streptogramin lyase